jgi:uncharacterized cofD-like protein
MRPTSAACALTGVSPQADAERGTLPRIVAIGGGTGLPNVLRGLRPLLYGTNHRLHETAPRDRLVAIVATSDDGGSSGKLRAEFNIIPPGDIRNCLAALSDNHALADVMNDFPRAVEIAARVVGALGTVLPATSEVVTLMAEFEDGRILSGETAISAAGGRIARLSIIPERPRFLPETCEAIARADAIVAGPGSLYTSVLPPLLVPQVNESIRRSNGTRVLVANLMTEPGETDDYSVLEHLLTIERHLGTQLFDYVIYNTSPVPEHLAADYALSGAHPIVTGTFEVNALERLSVHPIGVPLVSEHAGKIRHHPERLAAAIVAIGQGKLGAWHRRAEAGGL